MRINFYYDSSDLSYLRKELNHLYDAGYLDKVKNDNKVEYKVTKNTLLKLAAEKNDLTGLDKYLNKSTAIALSYDDPTSPAKVIKDFTKENDLPEVKGIVFEGEVLDGSEFKRFANVPSKEESLAKMIALLRSPLTKVAFALKSPMTSFGNVLNNLKENKSN